MLHIETPEYITLASDTGKVNALQKRRKSPGPGVAVPAEQHHLRVVARCGVAVAGVGDVARARLAGRPTQPEPSEGYLLWGGSPNP